MSDDREILAIEGGGFVIEVDMRPDITVKLRVTKH